jgi:hypothetical protein
MQHEYVCQTCGEPFTSHKKGKKYCSVKCSAARYGTVTKSCEICSEQFTVPYRFREVKTCGPKCNGIRQSRALRDRVVKQCLTCGKDFEVVPSYAEAAKYCSYDPCFLASRDTRQPDVEKTCEECGGKFTVPFTCRDQRFCGYGCSNSGENNGMFGKPGSMTGKPAWSRGLTKDTDPRLRALGEKISVIIADKMVSGSWSPPTTGFRGEHYVGTKNGGKEAYLRSSYESAFARMLDADEHVASWEHEPMRIPYLFEGSVRNYVPDFMITRIDATKFLIEVKPSALTDTRQNVAKRLAAEAWCELNGVELLAITEDELVARQVLQDRGIVV